MNSTLRKVETLPTIINGHRSGGGKMLIAMVAVLICVVHSPVQAQVEVDEAVQQVFPQADHSELGLRVPANEEPRSGEGRRVVVPGFDEEPVVAEIYLEYEHGLVVLLPDGHLMSIAKAKATPTERTFVPADEKEMTKELLEKFPGFKTFITPRHIFVYNCNPAFAKGTARIISSMYRKLYNYCQGIDDEVHEPRFPLVTIIFKTEEEFQKYRSMPPGIAAYYNGVSNHVLMYEQSGLTEIAPEFSMKQSISTVAHESVHQILHNVGIQPRLSRWPMWISEGLPEYFAPTQVTSRATWKGIGEPNDLRMYELKESLTSGDRALNISDVLEAEELDSLGYARSWALVHYLGQRNSRNLFAMLRDMSRTIQPGAERPEPGTYFAKHFGDTDDLDERVLEHLKKTPYNDPIANQTHYVALAESKTRLLGMAAISMQTINKWKQEVSQASSEPLEFRLEVFKNRSAAEAFMRRTFN